MDYDDHALAWNDYEFAVGDVVDAEWLRVAARDLMELADKVAEREANRP
jgi:hypothetical protein